MSIKFETISNWRSASWRFYNFQSSSDRILRILSNLP